MQKKFVIQTSSYGGIGDQIGTQFATLYKLGIALGYSYIHGIPFQFYRSDRPSYFEKGCRKLVKIIKRITGITLHSRFYPKSLADFLGVNSLDFSIQNAAKSQAEIFDVKLDRIIQGSEVNTLSELQTAIEQHVAHLNSNEVVLLFNWAPDMHRHLPKLHQMLMEVDRVSDADVNLFFSKRYWAARKNWKVPLLFDKSNNKLKVVLHIRLGDSTAVEIDGKKFYVHGNNVYSEAEFSSILEVDPNRLPINDLSKYTLFLDYLFAKYGEENFHCIILSDGYDATFQAIRSAHQRGGIELSQEGLEQLKTLRRKLDARLFNQFTQHRNIAMIVGETNSKLYQSIHALASSDIVVYGTGGFAFFLHHLLKQPEKPTLAINIKNYDQRIFETIGQMIPN